MEKNSAAATIAAALIVAIALIVSGLIVASSLDDAVIELADMREAIEATAARPTAAPARAARAGRPDPGKRYAINIKDSPVLGPEKARVTVVEFSDFQCRFCKRVWPTLQRIRTEYPDDVKLVFKHLPLSIHAKAPGAHAASQAAHRQGKFWEMHDLIFENNRDLSAAAYAKHAAALGLDVEQFAKDVKSAEVRKQVDADGQEAGRLGVSGTPGFFINGQFLSGAQPYESFKRLIDSELAKG